MFYGFKRHSNTMHGVNSLLWVNQRETVGEATSIQHSYAEIFRGKLGDYSIIRFLFILRFGFLQCTKSCKMNHCRASHYNFVQ